MAVNGRFMKTPSPPAERRGAEHVLHWPGRVVTAEALQSRLNGHREIVLPVDAVVTPLAEEQLRHSGVKAIRQAPRQMQSRLTAWGYGQDAAHPLIDTAVSALAREGVTVERLPALKEDAVCSWAKEVAACVAAGQCCGGVIFCRDPGLCCCVANKVPGLRAVPVTTILQAVRATMSVGANLLAVEMPGRTFFEIRQILRLVCTGSEPGCPSIVACTLQELDGHAHS